MKLSCMEHKRIHETQQNAGLIHLGGSYEESPKPWVSVLKLFEWSNSDNLRVPRFQETSIFTRYIYFWRCRTNLNTQIKVLENASELCQTRSTSTHSQKKTFASLHGLHFAERLRTWPATGHQRCTCHGRSCAATYAHGVARGGTAATDFITMGQADIFGGFHWTIIGPSLNHYQRRNVSFLKCLKKSVGLRSCSLTITVEIDLQEVISTAAPMQPIDAIQLPPRNMSKITLTLANPWQTHERGKNSIEQFLFGCSFQANTQKTLSNPTLAYKTCWVPR